jgi:hypothetical protein
MVTLRGGGRGRRPPSPSLSLTPGPLHLFSDLSNITSVAGAAARPTFGLVVRPFFLNPILSLLQEGLVRRGMGRYSTAGVMRVGWGK